MKHKDKWQPVVLMMLTTVIGMGAFYWMITPRCCAISRSEH